MYPQQGQEPLQGFVLKCPNCGAPLDVSPDDVVTICKYCGQVVSLRGDVKNALIAEALRKEELERRVFKDISRKVSPVTPLKGEIVFLPFYLFRAHVEGTVIIEKTVNKRRIHQTIPFSRDVSAAVYGRYGEFFGLEKIMDSVERKLEKGEVKLGKVNPEDAEHTKILGPQKDLNEATKEGRERAEFNASPIRAKGLVGGIGAGVLGVKYYDARVDLSYQGLYFYPVFLYTWKSGSRRFTTVADGTSGKVVITKLPISPKLRLAASIVTIASPLLIAPLSGFLGFTPAVIFSALLGLGSAILANRGDIVWSTIL